MRLQVTGAAAARVQLNRMVPLLLQVVEAAAAYRCFPSWETHGLAPDQLQVGCVASVAGWEYHQLQGNACCRAIYVAGFGTGLQCAALPCGLPMRQGATWHSVLR